VGNFSEFDKGVGDITRDRHIAVCHGLTIDADVLPGSFSKDAINQTKAADLQQFSLCQATRPTSFLPY
jgi:hypothetical protein